MNIARHLTLLLPLLVLHWTRQIYGCLQIFILSVPTSEAFDFTSLCVPKHSSLYDKVLLH